MAIENKISNEILQILQQIPNVLIAKEKIFIFNVWMFDKNDILFSVQKSLETAKENEEKKQEIIYNQITLETAKYIKRLRDAFESTIVSSGYFYANLNSVKELYVVKKHEPAGTYYLRPSNTIKQTLVLGLKDGLESLKPVRIKLDITADTKFIFQIENENLKKQKFLFASKDELNEIILTICTPPDQTPLKALKLYGGILPQVIYQTKLNDITTNGLDQLQINQILIRLFENNNQVFVLPIYADKVSSLEKDLKEQFKNFKNIFGTTKWLVSCFPGVIQSQYVNHAFGVAIDFERQAIYYQDDYFKDDIVNNNIKNFQHYILQWMQEVYGYDFSKFKFEVRCNRSQTAIESNGSIRTIQFLDHLINKTPLQLIEQALSNYYEVWVKLHQKELENLIYDYSAIEVVYDYLKTFLNPTNLVQVNNNPIYKNNVYGWKIGRGILTLFWPTKLYFYVDPLHPTSLKVTPSPIFESTQELLSNKDKRCILKFKGQEIVLIYEGHKHGDYYYFSPQELQKFVNLIKDEVDTQAYVNTEEIFIKDFQTSLFELSNIMNNENTVKINAHYSEDNNFLEVEIDNIDSYDFLKFINWIKYGYLLSAFIKNISGEILNLHLEKNKSDREKCSIIHNLFCQFKFYVSTLDPEILNAINDIKTQGEWGFENFTNTVFLKPENYELYLSQANELVMSLEGQLPQKAEKYFEINVSKKIPTLAQFYFTPKNFLTKNENTKKTAVTKVKFVIPKEHSMIQRVTKRVNGIIEERSKKSQTAQVNTIINSTKSLVFQNTPSAHSVIMQGREGFDNVERYSKNESEINIDSIFTQFSDTPSLVFLASSELGLASKKKVEDNTVFQRVNKPYSLWSLFYHNKTSSMGGETAFDEIITQLEFNNISVTELSNAQQDQLRFLSIDLMTFQANLIDLINSWGSKQIKQNLNEKEIGPLDDNNSLKTQASRTIVLEEELSDYKIYGWFKIVEFLLMCAQLTDKEEKKHQFYTAAMMVAVADQGEFDVLIPVYLLMINEVVKVIQISELSQISINNTFYNYFTYEKINSSPHLEEALKIINVLWNQKNGYFKTIFNTMSNLVSEQMKSGMIWPFVSKELAELLLKLQEPTSGQVIFRIGSQPETLVATYYDNNCVKHFLFPGGYLPKSTRDIMQIPWEIERFTKYLPNPGGEFVRSSASNNALNSQKQEHYFKPHSLWVKSVKQHSQITQPYGAQMQTVANKRQGEELPGQNFSKKYKDKEKLDWQQILEKMARLEIANDLNLATALKKLSEAFKGSVIANDTSSKIDLKLFQENLIKAKSGLPEIYIYFGMERNEDACSNIEALIKQTKQTLNLTDYFKQNINVAILEVVDGLLDLSQKTNNIGQEHDFYIAAMMYVVAATNSMESLTIVYLRMLHKIIGINQISELTYWNIYNKLYMICVIGLEDDEPDQYWFLAKNVWFFPEYHIPLIETFWNTYKSSCFKNSFNLMKNNINKLMKLDWVWLFLSKDQALQLIAKQEKGSVIFSIGTQPETLVATYIDREEGKIKHFLLDKEDLLTPVRLADCKAWKFMLRAHSGQFIELRADQKNEAIHTPELYFVKKTNLSWFSQPSQSKPNERQTSQTTIVNQGKRF